MLPITEYPDAEAAVIDYLLPLIEADPDYADTTVDVRGGDGHHIRVRRIGGIEHSPAHDQPTLDVIVWHDSDRQRMKLAQRLRAWLIAANNDRAGTAVVTYQSTVMGPRQLPDPADDTKTVAMFTVSMLVRPN